MAAATLRFEIWSDPASHSHQLSKVTPDGDALRRAVSPEAVLVHTFDAVSDFDAFQQSHDWHGFGVWKAPPGVHERFFSTAEAVVQQEYLALRAVG